MAANHPQLGAALNNIAELNRVYQEHQRESLREAEAGSRGGEKSAKDAKKRKREKKPKKRKDKKRKDDRKSKKRKREKDDKKHPRKKSKSRSRKERESSSSSSSSSSGSSGGSSGDGSDDDASSDSEKVRVPHRETRRTPEEELRFGRVAVDTARDILARFPDVRADLARILRSVDAGEAVSVEGVPDAVLRASLTTLFDALGLRALNARTGVLWSSRQGARATLDALAPAFANAREQREEAREEKASRRGDAETPGDGEALRERFGVRSETGDDARSPGDISRAHVSTDSMVTARHETVPLERYEALRKQKEPEPEPLIGPSARKGPPLARKKTLGPAMPPRAMLEAAALESTYAVDEAVGPAPPEIVREVELVGAEARVAAAARVLAAARANGDAYDILGVEDIPGDDGVLKTPSASTLKKLFWKLSLSVHPDKCAHPDAAAAFDAVKKAHETLCDPAARSKVDAAREERSARAGFDSWLKQEQAKARWRATRGEAAPGDEALLRGAVTENESDSLPGREEWMTKLPEQRRPVAGGEPSGSGGHAKAFARTTFVERDARTIAEWTAAPNEIAETEKRLFLAAQEAKYASPAAKSAEEDALRLAEQIAGASRGKTLLEKHQEREARAAKAAREAAKAAKKEAREAKKAGKEKGFSGAGDAGDDGTGWSYRPWNRETDLEAGRASTKALSAGELLEKAGGDLKGRFGSGGTEGGGR